MTNRKQKIISHGIESHNDQINKLNQQYITSQAVSTHGLPIERILWGKEFNQ
jgi:hypothetical protein